MVATSFERADSDDNSEEEGRDDTTKDETSQENDDSKEDDGSSPGEGLFYLLELENTLDLNPGISVSEKFGRVVVSQVNSGLISQWNADHEGSGRQVEVGDQIISINDDVVVAIKVHLSLEKMNLARNLRMKLYKPYRHTLQMVMEGNKLGLNIDNRFIAGITPGGFFEKWLRANSTFAVAAGDFILSVNGETEPEKMLCEFLELAGRNSFTLVIGHYETLGSKA